MKLFEKELSIKAIAENFNLKHTFSRDILDQNLNNVCELQKASKNSLCFIKSEKYLPQLKESKVIALITTQKLADKIQRPCLITEDPYYSFIKIVEFWLSLSKKSQNIIDSSAIIDKTAKIGKNSSIGANSFIGENVEIGENCNIYSNVSIYSDCKVGKGCIIHSGAIIGADGFGFILKDEIQHKIPQVGNVVLKDYVEIGANCCIDRATLGSTVIGKGSKIDNLVQIAHNCKIGEYTCISAQCGLAGNSKIGNYCYLAGQVGVNWHIKIGNFVKVGGQSGVTKDVPDNSVILGYPATDIKKQKKILIATRKLPSLIKKLKKFQ